MTAANRTARAVVRGLLAVLSVLLVEPDAALAQRAQDAGSVLLMKNYYRESGVWKTKTAPSPNPLARQRTAGSRCDDSDSDDGWWSLCKGSKVYWGDSFRLEENTEMRLKLQPGVIVLLPRVREGSGREVLGVEGTVGLYSLREEGDQPVIDIERGALIARRWKGSRERSFRMVASGMNADVTGTSWVLSVGADSIAELIVDVDSPGGKILLTRRDGAGERAHYSDAIPAFPGRVYRWKDGQFLRDPDGVALLDPEAIRFWSDVIKYNAEDIWNEGGFPWVVIVPAVAVPVVLCVIFCGGDDGGKTGTVTIPIP